MKSALPRASARCQAERPDLYEPDGYVAKELIERQRLVDQLTAVVAAT
jgi:hypothetical protein